MYSLSIVISALISITGVWNPWQYNEGNWDEIARLLSLNGYDSVFYCAVYGPVTDGEGLRECIDACSSQGIDVHAWIVLWKIRLCPEERQDSFSQEGRLQVSSEGDVLEWLCPTDPRNVRLMAQTILELAEEYPITGIHLDYIRYAGYQACFCDGCLERFEQDTGNRVIDWPDDCIRGGDLYDSFMEWRAGKITDVIHAVRDSLSSINRVVMLSVAVMPKEREMILFGQMWNTWLCSDIIDFVVAMNYTESDSQFILWGEQQLEIAGDESISCGIGSYSSRATLTSSETEHQQILAEELGFDGWVIFHLCDQLIENLRESEIPHTCRPIRNQSP